jgi:hypothetical protein
LDWVKKALKNIWEGCRRLDPGECLAQVEDGVPDYLSLDLMNPAVPKTECLTLYLAFSEALRLSGSLTDIFRLSS